MKLRFAAIALSATLVACGGGSGDDGLGDTDVDGVPVIGGGDDVDTDGGLDFTDDETVVGAIESDNCGALADGTLIGGLDNDSSNPDWSDNCDIRRNIHVPNTYIQGIQRIVFCTGNTNLPADAAINSTNLNAFADGNFGMNTEDQVRGFQEANGIPQDGQVGAMTWAALQDALEVAAFNDTRNANVHRVTNGVCQGVSQFEQNFDQQGRLSGWVMISSPGGDATVPFALEETPVQ